MNTGQKCAAARLPPVYGSEPPTREQVIAALRMSLAFDAKREVENHRIDLHTFGREVAREMALETHEVL